MLDEARQLASQLANPSDRSRLNGLCSDIERLANQLAGKIISCVTKLVQNSALQTWKIVDLEIRQKQMQFDNSFVINYTNCQTL